MAFFDQMSKRISKAGTDVAQSTKNMAATSKLNNTIAEEERRIANLYAQIGKAYFELHRMDPEAGLAGSVNAINEALARIDQCKEQIQKIRGIVVCPGCGIEVSSDSAFCNACGTRLPKAEVVVDAAPKGPVCTKCGAKLTPGQRFCVTCGTPVAGAPAAVSYVEYAPTVAPGVTPAAAPAAEPAPVEEPAAPAPAPVAAPEPLPAVRCPNCGAEMEPDALFCLECGEQLR